MAKVFVSYSRKDIDFAKRLTTELKKSELDFWIDWEGIPPTVDWWREIEKGIEEADAFLFLISPDSARSKVCRQEIETAVKNGKRIIPIVVREIEWQDTPPQLSHLNYIFFSREDDFDTAVRKLLTAVQMDYEWAATHRRLQVKALEWERNNNDKSFLLRGKDLQEAEFQLVTNTSKEPYPTDLQRKYVFASRKAADRQRTITLSISIAGVITLALLAVWGWGQAKLATNRANIARAGELAGLAISEKDRDFSLALIFGVEAYQKQPNARTESIFLTLMDSHAGIKQYLFGHEASVSSVGFSPDGKILASRSVDGTLILWDVSDLSNSKIISTISDAQSGAYNVEFSSDGKSLASGNEGGVYEVWDINIPAAPIELDSSDAWTESDKFSTTQTLSSDGKIQASWGWQTYSIELWDVSSPDDPKLLSTIEPESDYVMSVIFTPDGKSLVAGFYNKSIHIWDLSYITKPQERFSFSGQTQPVTSLAISPDGNYLASGSDDGSIVLWQIVQPTSILQKQILPTHNALVTSVAFSPDGKLLASADYGQGKVSENGEREETFVDPKIILWKVDSGTISPDPIITLPGGSEYDSLAFSPDGKTLATSFSLWNIDFPDTPSEFSDLPFSISKPAFSPIEEILARGNIIWNVHNPAHPIEIATLPEELGWVQGVSFSADGKLLATYAGQAIQLWDMNTTSVPEALGDPIIGHTMEVRTVAFSPTEAVLASGSEDSTIILWDVSNPANPQKIRILKGHSLGIRDIAFSPDGNWMASASWEPIILLWDVSNPANAFRFALLTGQKFATYSLAFSPDGKSLVSGNWDENLILWDLDPASWVDRSCQIAGRNFTQAEWAQYFPGEKYPTKLEDATCPQWPLDSETTPTPIP